MKPGTRIVSNGFLQLAKSNLHRLKSMNRCGRKVTKVKLRRITHVRTNIKYDAHILRLDQLI